MSDDDLTGTVLGHYRIERRLGGGGMGDVWAAVQEPLGRRVALKVLRHELASDAELAARFRREAELAASLSHPNIAQVTDFGVESGRAYLVMDLLQGDSLAALLAREGALDETRARRIAVQVLSALAVAHDRGVVHRDVKPENVFVQTVGETDVVKLLDFGIARIDERNATMTRDGAVLGTPAYMSPEQARGVKVDARSDVFSVGAMMYEMLSGRCPFTGPNLHAVLFAVVESEPTPLEQLLPGISPVLTRAVGQAMRKDPAARFANARDMIDALGTTGELSSAPVKSALARAALESAPTVAADTVPPAYGSAAAPPRRLPVAALAAASFVAVICAAAYLWLGPQREPTVALPTARPSPDATTSLAPPSSVAAPPTEIVPHVSVDAGEPPEVVAEIAAPATEVASEHRAASTPPSPTVVTVTCGGSSRELPVVRTSDRLTFGSAEGLGDARVPTSAVREAFNTQAAAGLARCYRGHAMRAGQEFDVDVDDAGQVTRVEVGSFCPVDPAVVSCARRVLGTVEVPTESAFRVRLGADIVGR